MKKYICTILAGLGLALSSCSDSYLDQSPQHSLGTDDAFSTPASAQMVLNGVHRLMVTQYLGTQGLNGEGTYNLYYGELQGGGLQKCNWTGWSNTINGNYHESNSNSNAQLPWMYYYRLLSNVNQVIANIPEVADDSSDKAEWDYVEAQARTIRAYSYMRLTQMYSRRWSDRNGESRGVVLRLEDDVTTTADALSSKPASSLKQVYKAIYNDLDTAIALFESCGNDRGTSGDKRWLTNVDVAHAVYSRAALNRLDYNTCVTHSQMARKNYPLMSYSEYAEGFNSPNGEWIWEAYNADDQTIYYYSFFAYTGSNSGTSSNRTYPIAISRQLVEQIDESDSRRALYAIPTQEEIDLIGSDSKHSWSGSGAATSSNNAEFYRRIMAECGDRCDASRKVFFWNAQKFLSQDALGVGCICLFRSAEMIYNEAEAQLALGNEAAVRALLEEAVAPYQDNYTCTKTGDELKAELYAYRAFDLFGEGHNWFDMKRRGDTLTRLSFANGGSWNTSFTAGSAAPEDKNRWTYVYPQWETQYNSNVQTTESDDWKVGD